MQQAPQSATETKGKRNKPAFRNRRRADRLPAMELRGVQADFELRRNSEDVGRDYLLPRAETVDAVLIGHGARLQFLTDQVNYIRRQMGIATTATSGPFLLEKGEPNVRQFVQDRRKSA